MHVISGYSSCRPRCAHGRITNPPIRCCNISRAFHINSKPTYQSMYPPAQALMLRRDTLGGHPSSASVSVCPHGRSKLLGLAGMFSRPLGLSPRHDCLEALGLLATGPHVVRWGRQRSAAHWCLGAVVLPPFQSAGSLDSVGFPSDLRSWRIQPFRRFVRAVIAFLVLLL